MRQNLNCDYVKKSQLNKFEKKKTPPYLFILILILWYYKIYLNHFILTKIIFDLYFLYFTRVVYKYIFSKFFKIVF